MTTTIRGSDNFDSAIYEDSIEFISRWVIVDNNGGFAILDSHGISSVTDSATGKATRWADAT